MADIGEKLSEARKAKGMSISDVEKITKIQSRYLTAIEQNDYDKLPGDFYVRAFIRQYANVVGLDGKKLLESYQQDVPAAKPDEYVEDSIDNQTEKVKKATQNKKGMWQAYLPKALGIIGALVVIMLIYLVFSHFFGGSQQAADNKSNNVTVSQTAPKKKKSSAPLVKKTSAVKIEKVRPGVYRVKGLKSNRKLTVSSQDSTWAQIAAGTTRSWSNTLPAGGRHSLTIPKGTNRVVVNFGNARSATIKVAGKRVPFTRTNGSLRITLLLGSAAANSSNQTPDENTGIDNSDSTSSDISSSSNAGSQANTNQTNQSSSQEQSPAATTPSTQGGQRSTGGSGYSYQPSTTTGGDQGTTNQGSAGTSNQSAPTR